MTVVCLKLISGEEVIGTRVDNKDSTYKDLASIVMMPGQNGVQQVSLGLMPFLPYSDNDEFTFNSHAIVIEHTPNQDLINNYNRIFGAGIQVVSSMP